MREYKLTDRLFILSNESAFLNEDITSANLSPLGNMPFLRDWLILSVGNDK